jgi:hypothetical protein
MNKQLIRTTLYLLILAGMLLASCSPTAQAAPATQGPATQVALAASATPAATTVPAATVATTVAASEPLCADWNAYLAGGCQIPRKPDCKSQAELDATIDAAGYVTDAQGNQVPNPFKMTCWYPAGGFAPVTPTAVETATPDPSVCASVDDFKEQYIKALIIVGPDGQTVSEGVYPDLQPIADAPIGPGRAEQGASVCDHFAESANLQMPAGWTDGINADAERIYCERNVPKVPAVVPDGLVPAQVFDIATKPDCGTANVHGYYKGQWVNAYWRLTPGSALDQQARALIEAQARMLALQDGLPTDEQLQRYTWRAKDLNDIQQQIAGIRSRGSYLRMDWGKLDIMINDNCTYDERFGAGCPIDLWAHQVTISRVDLASGQTTVVSKDLGYNVGEVAFYWFAPRSGLGAADAQNYAAQGGLFSPVLSLVAPQQ